MNEKWIYDKFVSREGVEELPDGIDYTKWEWINIDNNIITENSGIYMINIVYGKSKRKKIMYIGMSSNLKQRISNHPVKQLLIALGFIVKIHFIVTYKKRMHFSSQLKETSKIEKRLIEEIKPPLNYQYNMFTSFSIEKMIKEDLFS